MGLRPFRLRVYYHHAMKTSDAATALMGIVTLRQEQSSGRTKPGKKVQDVVSSAALCCQLDPRDLVPNPESLRTFLAQT